MGMNVIDNTKVRFDELEGGDIFTCKIKGEEELCLKLSCPVKFEKDGVTHNANVILLLTGEPLAVIDGASSFKHQNVTLELN